MINNSHSAPLDEPPLISEETLWWMRMAVLGVTCQCVGLLGVTTNAINVVVFVKLSVRDPMNISLLGLSISDFFGCLSIIWFNLCLFPPFMELHLPFKQLGAHYLFGSWVHLSFVKITTLITAFITMERCFCVAFPLKVKEMITSKRVTVVIVFFYVLIFSFAAPSFYVNYHDWVFDETRNRTLYTLVFRENRAEVESTILMFIGVILPLCSFFLTVACTAVLVYKLKQNAKWRQEATTGATTKQSDASQTPAASSLASSASRGRQALSSRDSKVAKMVAMISGLYLACFGPTLVSTVSVLAIPDMTEGGSRQNLLHFVYYVNFLLETINSSLNIFIYIYMSSNYRTMMRNILNIKSGDGDDKK